MPEAIGGHGELHGMRKGLPTGATTVASAVSTAGGAADPLQEVVHHRPLVVVRHDPLRLGEDVARERRGQQQVHDGVVEAQHRVMELHDDQVLVVARVADDGRVAYPARAGRRSSICATMPPGVPLLLGPPGPVLRVGPQLELDRGRTDRRTGTRRGTGPGPARGQYSESRSSDGLRMLLIVFASVAASSVEETSNVMSWSTNWPKYVKPAGIEDTPASAGLCEFGFGSRPGSPIMLPSWPSSACVATLNGSLVAVRDALDDM